VENSCDLTRLTIWNTRVIFTLVKSS